MKALLQRVKTASVSVDGQTVSKIGRGLLVFVGIGKDATEDDMHKIVRKFLNIRLWSKGEKGWADSVMT